MHGQRTPATGTANAAAARQNRLFASNLGRGLGVPTRRGWAMS
jgi:hypothetical protein